MSVRGNGEPALLEVDLDAATVGRRLPVGEAQVATPPANKGGTAGLAWRDGHLVVATWDSVAAVDPASGRIEQVWTDRRFSDLHGLGVDPDGRILVTSTNVDGVFAIDGDRVEAVWYATPGDRDRIDADERDLRHCTKHDVDYHRMHVNDVEAHDGKLLITFLGTHHRGSRPAHLATKLLGPKRARDRWLRWRWYDGGILVVDETTGTVEVELRTEGLHDAVTGPDGAVYATEYFGAGLVAYRHGLLADIPLEPGPGPQYLTRGILFDGGRMWVGHTVVRHREADAGPALLREYELHGAWTGREVRLPGVIGAYSLVPAAPAPRA